MPTFHFKPAPERGSSSARTRAPAGRRGSFRSWLSGWFSRNFRFLREFVCFASYASDDRDRVAPLVELLRTLEQRVFFDRDSIPNGALWERELRSALRQISMLFVFWSKHAATSDWVRMEWRTAQRLGKVLIPVILDNTQLPDDLAAYQGIKLGPAWETPDVAYDLQVLGRELQSAHNRRVSRNWATLNGTMSVMCLGIAAALFWGPPEAGPRGPLVAQVESGQPQPELPAVVPSTSPSVGQRQAAPDLLAVQLPVPEKAVANPVPSPVGSPDSFKPQPQEPGLPLAGRASYQVQPGDTLSTIARRAGVNAQLLASLNGLDNPDQIRAGQELILPGAMVAASPVPAPVRPLAPASRASLPDQGLLREYRVMSGDTLSSIARTFATTEADLRRLNDLSGDRIQVGQILRVPAN